MSVKIIRRCGCRLIYDVDNIETNICARLARSFALLIVEIFPNGLINLFGARNESEYYRQFAVYCFRTYLCMMVLATVNKGCFIFLQALGKAMESMFLSLFREIVLGVALPILLPLSFGLYGVVYSFPAADILTFIAAAIIIARTYKWLNAEKTPATQTL